MGNVPFSWEQMNIQAYHHSPSGIRCANTGCGFFLFIQFKRLDVAFFVPACAVRFNDKISGNNLAAAQRARSGTVG